MIAIKDSNGDLVSLANKSDVWQFYNTKQAAEDALANGEIAEGNIVATLQNSEVDEGAWQSFTPYSWSNMNSTYTFGLRRKEGAMYHYLIRGRTSSSLSSGDYTNIPIRLYDTVPAGFAFKWYQVGAGNEGTGRPFAYIGGAPDDTTTNMPLVITNQTGNVGYMWINLEIYTTED